MQPYEGNEKEHWESRVRSNDRYSSVGISSFPNSINRFRKEALFEVIQKVLDEFDINPEGRSILDAGCGTGIYSEYYATLGAEVTGVDLSEAAIDTIENAEIPGDYYQSSLEDLPFSDHQFDLVHVFSVLYHIVDDSMWAESLSEIDRVTSPGGIVLMRTEWLDDDDRRSDHVKHRSKKKYIDFFTKERDYTLESIYTFEDVVVFRRFFITWHKVLPNALSERIGYLVKYLSLLNQNETQRVVAFRKRRC